MSSLISSPTKKLDLNDNTKSLKEIREERFAEIKRIEESMRMLYFGNRINDEIVRQYNYLEKKWKKLTGHRS